MLSCHVTIVHDAQAPSNTITCSEAASHLAIGEAFRTIARGAADICICGGAESKLNPMGLMRQALLKRLSGSACRPFDVSRDGMVIGEGGGLLILEEYEHARNRGARIYAEVVGFGASTNTHSWSEPCPEGKGIALAVTKALGDAGLPPRRQSHRHVRLGPAATRPVRGPRPAAALGPGHPHPRPGPPRATSATNGAGAGAIDRRPSPTFA